MEDEKGLGLKHVVINRDVLYSKQLFDKDDLPHQHGSRSKTFVKEISAAARRKTSCSYLKSFFPFLTWLRAYDVKKNLQHEIISGLCMACVNVPQGLACSQILGVPAQYGLYTACFHPFIYFLFGGSPHLAIGTYLTLTMICVSSIDRLSVVQNSVDVVNKTLNGTTVMIGEAGTADGPSPEEVAMSLALAMGLWLILFSIVGLGRITTIVSDQFMQAFINAVCAILLISQLKGIFGLSIQKTAGLFSNVKDVVAVLSNLPNSNPVTVGLSVASAIVYAAANYLLNERYKHKVKIYIPMELILVVISTAVSHLTNLHEEHSVFVIGAIPQGFAMPRVPRLTLLPDLMFDSLLLAIILFASMHCYSEFFSKTYGTPRVSPNQELLAFGMTNAICSFFLCVPGAAAFARSKVQALSGGKTQVATLVTSMVLLLVVACLGPAIYSLPKCVLSVLIIASTIKLVFNLTIVKQLWKNSKLDLLVYIFVYLTTLFANANYGMTLGITFSLLVLVYRLFNTDTDNLQSHDHTEIYHKISPITQNEQVHIVRFNGSINFISRDGFKNIMVKKITLICAAPQQLHAVSLPDEKQMPPHKIVQVDQNDSSRTSLPSPSGEEMKVLDGLIMHKNGDLIVSFALVAFIDYSGLETLKEVVAFAEKNQVKLYICCCTASVYSFLKKSDFFSNFSEDRMYASVHDAVCFINR